jgi:hypothetical protein
MTSALPLDLAAKKLLSGVTNDDNNLDHYLKTFKDEASISQSISSTSQALGAKTVSSPIAPPSGFTF